jgi:DNA anti-recombination protein RmuC
MIDAEVNKAKLAEQEAQRIAIEKSAAEEKAKKDAEEAAMAAQRAEIAARQAELDRAERDSRLKIEEEQRAARMKIEEESRQARLAQQARDEVARVKAEQEAAILKAAKDKLDAEQREVQRKANELNDGYEMLATFVRRFGKVGEFIGVAQAIESYLQKTKAAA